MMSHFWSKARLGYDAIVTETIAWLQECTHESSQMITEGLHESGVPWQNVCNLYGGTSGRFPEEPIRAALDSFLLKTTILAILADGDVSEDELATCWPMTSELAESLGRQFSDLRNFDHSAVQGHCAFLRAFNEKENWFGGACDWTLTAAPMLVLYASAVADAHDEDSGDNRNLFKRFRSLCIAIVRDILVADGVNDAESSLINNLSNHFDALLETSQVSEPSAPHDFENRLQPSHKSAGTSIANGARQQKTVSREEALEVALRELQQLIGLQSVKQEVQRLTSFLRIQEERRRQNLKTASQSLHFVFKGNPGTGKTVVARILGQVFYGFGILDSYNVVECDRSKLVAAYVGQTAIKTDEVIDSALNGVLFIDEAYTLSKQSGRGDEYGEEAINQLLKRMEDDRNRLILVVAGYPKLMDEFIATNPGLKSRFTRYITFDDYTPAELCQIFEKFAKEHDYKLNEDCMAKLAVLFTALYMRRGDDFGNARDVRNIYEQAQSLHSERLDSNQNGGPTREQLTTISGDDVSGFLNQVLGDDSIDFANVKWRFSCPSCGHSGQETSRFLGRRVKCKCGTGFTFPWWDVIPESVPNLLANGGKSSNPFLPR